MGNVRFKFALLMSIMNIGMMMAQQVSGRVVGKENEAIPYANIVLQKTDSAFVAGCTTDEKGLFHLQAPATDDYRLVVSYIGYETLYISLNHLEGKQRMGNIQLTEAAQQLGEVSVVGANTVRRVDRQVVVPSQEQLQSSATGYHLLSRLMLPNLNVDPVQNKVSVTGGGAVEFRINDIKATQSQLLSLNPTHILRVEYIDNPGSRYGDTEIKAVINYVVKQRDDGYSGGFYGNNALYHLGMFGDNNLYIFANKGKSQFGLDYYFNYRDYDKRRNEEEQTFVMDDQTKRNRMLDGINTPFGYTQHQIEASYNYQTPDKFLFRAIFSDEVWRTNKQDFASIIRETNQPDLYSYTHAKDNYQAPSLDLYAAWTLPHHQKFVLDAVGTYITTDYARDYRESLVSDGTQTSDYSYTTDGDRYSFVGEGFYTKSWDKVKLTVGLKGMTAYTHNVYTGSNDVGLNQHTSSFYGYAEVQGQLQKLNYQLGAGVSKEKFSRGADGYSFVTFRPSVSLYMPLFKGAGANYSFSVSPRTPSLSQLSEVEQQQTNLQVNVGNEDLTPYRRYYNRLNLSWQKNRVSIQLSGLFNFYNNPIMQLIEREGSGSNVRFVKRYINADKYAQWGSTLSFRWVVVPKKLNLNLQGGVNRYHTESDAFCHYYTAYNGMASASYSISKFLLSCYFSTRYKSLWGEEIDYGEYNGAIAGYYQHNSLALGLTWSYPLSSKGWSAGTTNLSPLAYSRTWTYIKDNANMVTLTISWRFSNGKKYNRADKNVKNVDRERGI